ncbi:MAG: outer membrane protein assembly factor BamC [Azoarcus sp.]|uniref:Beta-barrel assembly machine subunit BamC n=1 Tax=Aromatoleum tolulyticum TaxID=34027 RepID=A0A1N6VHG4_9RHOO|nr:outer membrane protein assembly factor BamC [Aromatoleum tolulyticum]MCK9984344.1 outer membrane protein assembly factor BamC [Azoarcus sp.]SIQ77217.1 Beta-barrel assembly machine subunit BamC [Aromatoleum tolulyticum]
MNRTLRTAASLLGAAIALSGCSGSLVESKKIDYKSARQLPSLEIPPDLTAPTRDDRYVVPDVSPKGVATYSAYATDRAQPQPAASQQQVLPKVESMRVERAGSQRWLVVQGSAETMWPKVKDFWLETGFILNVERPEVGVMETDWAEDRAKIPQDFIRSALGKVLDGVFSTPVRDKFRTRLEAGKDPDTVEIYISHRGMMEIYPNEAKDSTVWQPRPADPELEAEMLRRLMVRLGAAEERAAAIVAAAPAAERAALKGATGGSVTLAMDESFDRAWRRVGLALDRIGFTVEDRDRSKGLFFVRYVDPDADVQTKKSEGILSKLAFWRSNEQVVQKGGEYRLRVRGEGEKSVVSVMTREGGEDSSETARKILALLQEQLR